MHALKARSHANLTAGDLLAVLHGPNDVLRHQAGETGEVGRIEPNSREYGPAPKHGEVPHQAIARSSLRLMVA